jgi:hypothetical protein
MKGGGLAAVSLVGGRFLREALMPNVRVMGGLDPQNVRTLVGCVGIRGAWGQQPIVSALPGYPGIFDTDNITDFATLQNAVNAAGSARKFHVTSGFPFTAPIAPHAGDEFWFNGGTTFTMSGGPFSGIAAASANGVKVMNGKFVGFDTTAIDSTNSTGWEVAYCEIDGQDVTRTGTGVVKWVHNCKIHRVRSVTTGMFQVVDGIIEDNELGPSMANPISGGGNKFVGTTRIRCGHNWIHGMGVSGSDFLSGTGQWLDFANYDAIIEWNLVEGNNGPGIFLEVNAQGNENFTNIIRNNLIRNNGREGIGLAGSMHTEVYGNELLTNQFLSGDGEISLSLLKVQQDTQDAELKENHIFQNKVVPTSGKRGAILNVEDTVAGYSDYVTNLKDNTWDYNTYDFDDPAASNIFRKEASNLTWAQWQAGGTPTGAGAQDVNGSAS